MNFAKAYGVCMVMLLSCKGKVLQQLDCALFLTALSCLYPPQCNVTHCPNLTIFLIVLISTGLNNYVFKDYLRAKKKILHLQWDVPHIALINSRKKYFYLRNPWLQQQVAVILSFLHSGLWAVPWHPHLQCRAILPML